LEDGEKMVKNKDTTPKENQKTIKTNKKKI
jgi:hypothetical protein